MLIAFLSFLFPFWFARSVKQILFWVYLWQLKQYHRGRFFDHFKTQKGKRLLLHPLQISKIILLVFSLLGIFFLPGNYLLFLPLILFLLYFLESLLYFKAIFSKRTKNPALTKKTIFLIAVNFLVAILFFVLLFLFIKNIFWFSFLILLFDILLPLVISVIVILFQPIADYYRLSLQKRAGEKISAFKKKKLKIIVITGSYGKTSTKEFLKTILSSKFKVLSTPEHMNTEIGIPQLILKELNENYEIFIAELGAYDKGTIKRICGFLQPEIGIVTGVNEQHLALFGSMENLLSTEGGRELLECLPEDGLLVVNGENDYCMDLYKKANIKKMAYNFSQIENINIKKDSSSFTIENVDFNVNILGKHNVLNFLGAVLVAKELGMSLDEISKAAKKITPKQSSLKIVKTKQGFTLIDSIYSSNPDGVIADLEYLKLYNGKKIIVMPCLIELGKVAKEVHQRIGRKIAEVCDLAIITTKEYYQVLKKATEDRPLQICFIENSQEIIKKIKEFCGAGDVVLLEGRLPRELIDAFIVFGS